METFTLRQGDLTAKLSEVAFQPAEGFQEDNTWHVAEEFISAESDTKLTQGPATLQHSGVDYPVTVSVLHFENLLGEDEEPEEGGPAAIIEIDYAEGVSQLARALGLT